MTKLKITKKNGSLILEVHPDLIAQLAEGETLELVIPERQAVQATRAAQGKPSLLSSEEHAVLLKLNSVKFDKRVPSEVSRLLSANEKSVLVSLLEKRYINVLKSKKYPAGVYNIADNIYPELKREPAKDAEQAPPQAQAQPATPSRSSAPQTPYGQLFSRGFAIVENEIDAKRLSEELGNRIKNGEVLGVRGFDKKFYVATKSFYLEHESKILSALTKEGKPLDQLAEEASISPDAARILLTLMADSGEIIEKRRGFFASA